MSRTTEEHGPSPVAPAHVPPTPVGRGTEIARLHEVADHVRRGHAARILLGGAPGVGTTTLADAFCDQVAADPDGAVVVRVAAPEPVGAPVAHATVELLARALDDRVAPERPTSGRSALALHDALVALRRATGPHRPVILALHDLHHADPASAAVLAELLRRLHGGGVLVLASATDPSWIRGRAWWPRLFAEGGAGPGPDGAALAGVPTEVRTVVVGGLDATSVAALVATRRPAAPVPGPAVAARLAAATGGHPVHLGLLLRTLPDAVLAGTDPVPGGSDLAARVDDAVAALTPATRHLVAALAVLGGPAPVALLEQVAAVAPGSTPPTAPAEAAAAGLVVVTVAGPRVELRLAHRLIRDAVYRRLSPGTAAALHRTAVAATGGRTGYAHAVASAAGSPAPGVADALVSAAAAETDHDEAATLLLWAAATAGSGVDREEHLLGAAVRLVHADASSRLRDLATELRAARACGARDLALGTLAFENGDPDAHVPLAAALADEDAGRAVRALAALKLGAHHVLHGRGARAVETAARIVELSDDPGHREGARALEVVGSALRWGPDTALDVLGDHLDGVYGPDLLVICGRLHLAAGDPATAYDRLHQGLDRIRAGSPTTMGRLVHLFLAEAAFRTGRWDEAEAEARVGATAAREAGSTWIAPAARGMWSVVRAARGAPGDADPDGTGRARERTPNALGAFTRDLAEAFVAHLRGDAGRAYRVLTDLADGPVPALEASPVALWRVLLAEVAIDADRLSTAGAVLQGFPAAGTPLWFQLARHRLLGRLAEHGGNVPAARESYRVGLELAAARAADAAECPIEVAALHAAAGRLARRQGWASAAEDLAAARRAFAGLGAAPWVARVDAEIDLGVPGVTSSAAPAPTVPEPVPGRVPDRVPEPVPGPVAELPVSSGPALADPSSDPAPAAALTPREREVVRLVAQGLTSREVAAELYVTPKAIGYHLGNVFAKLGVTSRRQLWGRTFE